MKKEVIDDLIAKQGYAIINVQDTYFYTVGMASQGKRDLFGIKNYPYGLFKIVAERYFNNDVQEMKAFFVHEYKIKAFGLEPTRIKICPLDLETNSVLLESLTKVAKEYKTLGFDYVAPPDHNNLHIGEEDCSYTQTIEEYIGSFINAVKKDLEIAQEEATKKLNEAQKLLKELGVK